MALNPDWPACQYITPCTGVRISGHKHCLAHLTADDRLGFLATLGPGDDLDLRGTTLTATLLDAVLARFRVPNSASKLVIGDTNFTGARFEGIARFTKIQFVECPTFQHTEFVDQVLFNMVAFPAGADFANAHFTDDLRLTSTDSDADLDLRGARFERSVDFEMVRVRDLRLDDARFAERVTMVIEAREISCDGTRFREGVALSVQYGRITAARTVFGAASTIGYPAEDPFHLWPIRPTWLDEPRPDPAPELVSLRDTDVSNLVITDVNLAQCEFSGAHRLDQLRVEGSVRFGTPPGWWHTRRQILIEEARSRRWDSQPTWAEGTQIAALYRSLRKSFEDSRNEAGAGDFYYGEMEMRRRSTQTRWAERAVLWGYWALSGYGQRAGRALLALLVLVAVVTGVLGLTGVAFEDAVRIAVGAVVLRDPGTRLPEAGQWTVMMARVFGPVLLALTVLAVRARVKR
jgi:hypothetical protein